MAQGRHQVGLLDRYRLHLKRQRLVWRSFRSRNRLVAVADRTGTIAKDDILAVVVVRNEARRLPYFLNHHRALGVGHFLVVDNASTDATATLLADQADVSVWRTSASYREARFGLDWVNWLLMRHGHGHWCLTIDADEVLVFAGCDSRGLRGLTADLDARGQVAFGALMLDMYPRGPLGTGPAAPDRDPVRDAPWFDPVPYSARRQAPMNNLWVRGGVRQRVFFADDPASAPTLNKLPLVRWNRRWAYVNSTHALLPSRLNLFYDGPGDTRPCGVLLHGKFLPEIVEKAQEDMTRQQHFHDPAAFRDYYEKIAGRPVLWSPASVRYEGWPQLVALGLMSGAG
jgi:glycosyltransferase involved in cell wall biosynthesis